MHRTRRSLNGMILVLLSAIPVRAENALLNALAGGEARSGEQIVKKCESFNNDLSVPFAKARKDEDTDPAAAYNEYKLIGACYSIEIATGPANKEIYDKINERMPEAWKKMKAAKAAPTKVDQDKKSDKEGIRKIRVKNGPTKYEVPDFAHKYARENRFIIVIGVNIVRDPETGETQKVRREVCYAPNSETMDCTCSSGKKQRFVREGRSMVYSNGIERSFVCQ